MSERVSPFWVGGYGPFYIDKWDIVTLFPFRHRCYIAVMPKFTHVAAKGYCGCLVAIQCHLVKPIHCNTPSVIYFTGNIFLGITNSSEILIDASQYIPQTHIALASCNKIVHIGHEERSEHTLKTMFVIHRKHLLSADRTDRLQAVRPLSIQ